MTKRTDLGAGQAGWYQVVSLFDGEAERVMTVAGHNIVLRGTLNLGEDYEQLAVCMIPKSLPTSHLEVIRQAVEGNLRLPVLMLTDNVHLCRLKRLTEKQAHRLLAGHLDEKKESKGNGQNGQNEAKIIPIQRAGQMAEIREVHIPQDEGDLRSPGSGEGAEHPGAGAEGADESAEEKQGPEGGTGPRGA